MFSAAGACLSPAIERFVSLLAQSLPFWHRNDVLFWSIQRRHQPKQRPQDEFSVICC